MPSAEAVTSWRPAATGVPGTRPVRAAAAAVTCADDLGRAGDRRQRAEQLVDPVEPQRLGRIVLGAHVGEGGARLGAVGADRRRSGRSAASPCRRRHVGDAGVAVGLVALDPGEQRRGRRGVRHLAGQRQRLVGDRAAAQRVDEPPARLSSERIAGPSGRAVGVEQVEAVAVRGRRDRGDVAGGPAAARDRLADRLGGGAPRARPCRARRGAAAGSTAAPGGARPRAGCRRRRRPPPW